MNKRDLEILYRYNRWANRRLFEVAKALPTERLHRDLGVSHKSIFGTLAHIVWGEWRWLSRWTAPAPAPAPAPGPDPLECRDIAALEAVWQGVAEAQERFTAGLERRDLWRTFSYQNPPGTTWTYSVCRAMQHVVNHSSYHRGQVAAFLRQAGVAPPATDLLVMYDLEPALAAEDLRLFALNSGD